MAYAARVWLGPGEEAVDEADSAECSVATGQVCTEWPPRRVRVSEIEAAGGAVDEEHAFRLVPIPHKRPLTCQCESCSVERSNEGAGRWPRGGAG